MKSVIRYYVKSYNIEREIFIGNSSDGSVSFYGTGSVFLRWYDEKHVHHSETLDRSCAPREMVNRETGHSFIVEP